MKIVRKGKEYDYPYKTIFVKDNQHEALQRVAKKNNTPLGKMIIKLVEHYESCIG
jgi:hypothetical protein